MRSRFAPTQGMKVYLGLLAYALTVYFLFRLAFFLHYRSYYGHLPFERIAFAFLRGERFDLSTLAAVAGAPFLALLALPGRLRRGPFGKVLLALPLPLFWMGFFLLVVDYYFYGEGGRRLSYEIFIISHDTTPYLGILRTYLGSLLFLVALSAAFSWGWFRIARRLDPEGDPPPEGIVRRAAWLLVFLFVSVVAVRGGFQAKPLRPSYAFADDSLVLGHLALNPVFTVAHTINEGKLEAPRSMPEDEAVSIVRGLVGAPPSAYPDPRYPLLHASGGGMALPVTHPNVVVLLLESWSGKFVGALGARESATPHFDRLARDGVLFTNFYANGQRSIEGMACLNCAIPTFRDTVLIGGSLEENSLRCLGSILKDAGYATIFLHGARTGSFGFDAFSRRAGFDRYWGMEDFAPGPGEYDPVWGVYDGPALERVDRILGGEPEPFLALWFSLTSHSPYHLPDSWSGRPRPGAVDAELENTIRYADDALGAFFEKVRRAPWFDRTVFVLLADHDTGSFETNRERFRIPCLFYAPKLLPPRRIDEVGSQLDLLPTILDLAGERVPNHAFGRSLFDAGGGARVAVLDNIPLLGWVHDDDLLMADGQKPLALYDYRKDPGEGHNLLREEPDLAARLDRELRAFVQVSKTLILENRLYPPPFAPKRPPAPPPAGRPR